jgi:hypothetical protein
MKHKLTKENKKYNPNYNVSVKGSLGLLAYGDIGLRAWRDVKKNALKK